MTLSRDLAISLALLTMLPCYAAQASDREKAQAALAIDLKSAQSEITSLGRQIEFIHRDQLNYRIEKDLLKEAFSSNLQSVNLTITIVFGVFALLGYAGMRSIKEVRGDYRSELDKLKELKGSFEAELESLRSKQREFEVQVAKQATVNDSQDRRLKLMELIEKVSSLISSRNYDWALEHISVGLTLDERNPILLGQQTLCYGRLGRMVEAIAASKKLLEIEPNNVPYIANLCEFLALASNEREFDEYYAQHRQALEGLRDGGLSVYLRALLTAMQGNLDRVKRDLVAYAEHQPPEPKARIEPWQFDDALEVVRPMATGPRKELLMALIQYFKGEMATADFIVIVRVQDLPN